MKKILFPIIMGFSLIACNNQEDVSIPSDSDVTVNHSRFRTPEQAWDIAGSLLSQDETSRSGLKLKPLSNIEVICSESSRAGETDTLYYAIDIEDNGGFILIAGPRSVEPVMAIIEEGSYNDPENLENEAYQMILDEMKTELQFSIIDPEDGKVPLKPIYWEHVRQGFTTQPAKVKVAWNQRWPENIFASNGIAGCTPVAVAQLLTYIELPRTINYQCAELDLTSENLVWADIISHKRSTTTHIDNCVECTATSNSHYTIARIIRELGHRMHSRYRNDSIITTSTYPYYISSTVKQLTEYDPEVTGESFNTLYKNLEEIGGVALVGGYEIVNEELTRGHTWIADGYRNEFNEIHQYELNTTLDPSLGEYIETVVIESVSELLHFNWGWGGRCNGWFNIINLKGNYTISSNQAESFDYSDMNPSIYSPNNMCVSFWLYKK